MKLTLNLASRTYINRRALFGFYLAFGGGLVLLLALGIGLYARNQMHLRQLRQQLAELGQQAATPSQTGGEPFTAAAYEKLLADIRFANEILAQDSFRWTDLLNRMEEVVPEKVAISGIDPDYKEKELQLTGLAMRVEDLQQFLDNLITSDYFTDVYLLKQSRIKSAGRNEAAGAISFSIVAKGAF